MNLYSIKVILSNASRITSYNVCYTKLLRHGYDDADQVFYVQDGRHAESQVVLYDNFGLNFTPFWYYEIFGDDVEITHEEMVLESLRIAIDDWP